MYLNELRLLEDFFFDVLIINVVIRLFLQDVVFVSKDLDLGFDLLYSLLEVLTSFFALSKEIMCEVFVLHVAFRDGLGFIIEDVL